MTGASRERRTCSCPTNDARMLSLARRAAIIHPTGPHLLHTAPRGRSRTSSVCLPLEPKPDMSTTPVFFRLV